MDYYDRRRIAAEIEHCYRQRRFQLRVPVPRDPEAGIAASSSASSPRNPDPATNEVGSPPAEGRNVELPNSPPGTRRSAPSDFRFFPRGSMAR